MPVNLQYREQCAIVTLCRPDSLNALSFDLLRELGEVFERVAGGDARALVITGAGDKAFCAGADIKELLNRPLLEQQRASEAGQRVFAELDGLRVPSVALINGYAFGGGLELALACTFRLAVPEARMGLPEVKLGLIPGYGGTQRLPRLIGEARALEMILTGRVVTAAEAQQIGLVNRVVTSAALETAISFTTEFTRYGLPALEFARDAVQRAATTTLREGLKIERDLSTLAYQTEDADEGMRAFVEKRTPSFRDR